VIPYLNYSIAINTFVNNIFRAVLLTLPSAFTGEGFVVISSTELGEVTGSFENLPYPSLPKRGIPPFVKEGKEGLGLQCLYNYGLTSKFRLKIEWDQRIPLSRCEF